MSASMLRQMLEDAGAHLKEQKYQQALDASRRVTQFDPNNFQAFMCVGLANFHLQQWDDCEEAYRRAAGLKPDLPLAWKVGRKRAARDLSLVDLFEERKQPQKKLEPLEKLVTILQKNKKVKACQKWVADVAATALELRMYPKAFDAWYSLLVVQSDETREICLDVTPNDELPSKIAIWLDLVDVLQVQHAPIMFHYLLPCLSDCAASVSQSELAGQFFHAASNWASDHKAKQDAAKDLVTSKLDTAIAFFMRVSLDELKAVKTTSAKKKQEALRNLDEQAVAVISWLPSAKIPAEYLLLRSEDQDSPIDMERATQLAVELESVHPKSPMIQIFNGLRFLEANETEQVLLYTGRQALNVGARGSILDALAYCASSSFYESTLCIRAQVELAALALSTRDVEGCLSRLAKAKSLLTEKAQVFGCAPPNPLVYSDAKAQLMEATAREYSGDYDQALVAYQTLVSNGDNDALTAFQATVRLSELLLSRNKFAETRDTLDALASQVGGGTLSDEDQAVISSIRGWVLFKLGAVDEGKALLESAIPKISVQTEKARALKRLAIVYWYLDGAFRREKAFCFGFLLQAAKLMPSDSEIFSWLGKWYQEIANDVLRAEKCFLKALSLSFDNEIAGVALSDLYEQQQKRALNVKLWEDMTQEPVSAPTWALLRLAQHLVENDDEQAVGKLHLVLQNDPFNARYWVTLGHVYRHFGKLVSAQKSYLKAVELGETSWCVMCELARIEGALLLFDEAFGHIEPFVVGDVSSSSSSDQQHSFVVSMLYAELLFKQAKYLCAEGLYGRAAANLKKASGFMTSLSSSSMELSSSVEGLKLIGDLHCFAFYLAPNDFENGSTGWVEFIAKGRKAYEAIAVIARSPASKDAFPPTRLVEVLYDVGLSCWYEAQALCNAHGIYLSGFEHLQASRGLELVESIEKHQPEVIASVKSLKQKAKQYFTDAVNANPQLALGWNGLGVIHDHVLLKQFAWARSIQAESNSEAAWANLGMLYVHHPEGKSTASLAQKALIHLQGVNANNPSMWNGYGMLSRRKTLDEQQQQKAIEAFRCALEMGLDLDALQGFTTAVLLNTKGSSDNNSEELLFAMRKVLERDPSNAGAWNALGVLQQRLGLNDDSQASFDRAQTLVAKTPWYAQKYQQEGLKWNTSLAEFAGSNSSDAFSKAIAAVQTQSSASGMVLSDVLKAQQLYHKSDGQGSLQVLTDLLARSDLATSERDAAAVIGLSIAGLLASGGDKYSTDAKQLSTQCKEHLLENLSTGISKLTLHVLEMHERATGSGSDCVSLLEIASAGSGAQPPAFVWSRLAFTMIDFQQASNAQQQQLLSRAFVSTKKLQHASGDETMDAAYVQTLVGLLLGLVPDGSSAAGTSAINAQKLVHMQPWDPYAYFLAGTSLLKSYALAPSAKDTLKNATSMLESGLRVAQSSSPSLHEFERSQLQWLLSFCYAQLGDTNKASQHATEAHEWIESTKTKFLSRALEFVLLDARVLSILSPSESIVKYHSALEMVSSTPSSSHRLAPILAELGAVYEEAGFDDCALQVWKSIASLTAFSPSESSAEPPQPELGAFFSNLRLALVHGKKQNTKTAKKQIKAAVAAAPSAESKQATVAAFVESVITKN